MTPRERMLFELAHSLGFPHYEQMLASMTARQFLDLMRFETEKAAEAKKLRQRAERARTVNQEAALKNWFARKRKQQELRAG